MQTSAPSSQGVLEQPKPLPDIHARRRCFARWDAVARRREPVTAAYDLPPMVVESSGIVDAAASVVGYLLLGAVFVVALIVFPVTGALLRIRGK